MRMRHHRLALLFLCASSALAFAGALPVSSSQQDAGESPTAIDNDTWIESRNMRMVVTNHGSFAYDLTTQDPGLEFPIGSGKTCVYASGLWIGAKVDGQVRVTAGSYTQEYTPGPIDSAGNWPDPGDPQHKVYKIVRGDTTSYDYVNWPSEFGAPVDENGKPLLKGDQTLWCVYNDANPLVHVADEGRTDPLGIEVQQTAFAFDQDGALGNAIFMEFKILNKLDNTLESTYFTFWSDPDVGGAADDFVGCDRHLGLGFAYNATDSDPIYGSEPPCVGYDLLKGPRGDGGWRQPMMAFCRYSNAYDPRSATESYNYMRGLNLDGSPVIDPTTGEVTRFAVSGDPVENTGWLDSDPGDRRFMVSAGPFTMEPGDTQDIALGIVVGQGEDRIASVQIMKEYDVVVQSEYGIYYGQATPPPVEAVAGDGEVTLTWTSPVQEDFGGILICYSTVAYPEDPVASLPVPNGNGGLFECTSGVEQSFTHSGLANGVAYYYTAFASDGGAYCIALGFAQGTPMATSSVGTAEPGGGETHLMTASPNPSAGPVSMRCSVPAGDVAQLTVYNTSGRRVRALARWVSTGSPRDVTWYRRDEIGEEMPPGIYFMCLRAGGRTVTRKVVLVQ